jgi:hypothetical protein
VRKRDVRRRKGRGERAWGWLVHHQDDEVGRKQNVKLGEEVGVCCVCGTGQFELFWGCAGCFEKEEERGGWGIDMGRETRRSRGSGGCWRGRTIIVGGRRGGGGNDMQDEQKGDKAGGA